MISICLCDDNPVILNKYNELLTQISKEGQLTVNIQLFHNGEQLLFYMEDIPQYPDIIYLDIMMDGRNGMETAAALRTMGCTSELIFLTSNPEYVFESFDVAPANYIIKDSVSEQRFQEIFFKTVEMAKAKEANYFTCSNAAVQKQIPLTDIAYFEIRNRIVTVYYGKESFDFYSRLDDVEKELIEGTFIRIHRSYLVQIKYIQQITKNSVLLATGDELPLGATYARQVKLAVAHSF